MLYHSFNYNDRYCGLMPYMLTVYDMIYADYPHLLKHARPFVERQIRLIQGAKSIIAISRHTANRIIQHVPINPDRITVAHLGVSEVFRRYGELSDEMQSAVTKKTGNRPFFMYVGVRESYKNFGLLLTAYARLAKGHDVDLCVFGGAEVFSPHEVDFIVQHGLTRRIHLFPACSDLLLKSAYQMTLGLVFPSIDEGFGIPPLEAMVCGAPVLAAAIPPVKEVCGNAPLYFDPCSIEELFICLESALNPGIKKELEEKGYHQAASYTWDRCADTHVRVYGEVFARMSGSPGIKLY